jgi:hypothetical protein
MIQPYLHALNQTEVPRSSSAGKAPSRRSRTFRHKGRRVAGTEGDNGDDGGDEGDVDVDGNMILRRRRLARKDLTEEERLFHVSLPLA